MPDIYDDPDLTRRANNYLESQKPQKDYLSDWNAREEQIAKMRESGQIGEPTGVVEMPAAPQPKPEREMSFGENLKDLGKAFAGGAVGVAADTLRGADWLYGKLESRPDPYAQQPVEGQPAQPERGLPSFRSAADSIDKFQEKNLAPEQDGFSRDLASGVGSLATFLIPGSVVAKGAGVVGKGIAAGSRAAKAMELAGLGVSTGLEALGETGGVVKANQKEGLSQEEIDRRATNTLLTNMALIGVTNKLGGMFEAGRRGSVVRKGVEGALGEGSQEFGQSAISQSQTGEGDINWKQAAKEGVLGSIIGGGTGMTVKGVEKARLHGFDKAADAWVEKANESLSSGAIQSMNDEQFKKVYDNAVTLNEVMNTEGDVRPEYFQTLSALDNEYKRRQGADTIIPKTTIDYDETMKLIESAGVDPEPFKKTIGDYYSVENVGDRYDQALKKFVPHAERYTGEAPVEPIAKVKPADRAPFGDLSAPQDQAAPEGRVAELENRIANLDQLLSRKSATPQERTLWQTRKEAAERDLAAMSGGQPVSEVAAADVEQAYADGLDEADRSRVSSMLPPDEQGDGGVGAAMDSLEGQDGTVDPSQAQESATTQGDLLSLAEPTQQSAYPDVDTVFNENVANNQAQTAPDEEAVNREYFAKAADDLTALRQYGGTLSFMGEPTLAVDAGTGVVWNLDETGNKTDVYGKIGDGTVDYYLRDLVDAMGDGTVTHDAHQRANEAWAGQARAQANKEAQADPVVQAVWGKIDAASLTPEDRSNLVSRYGQSIFWSPPKAPVGVIQKYNNGSMTPEEIKAAKQMYGNDVFRRTTPSASAMDDLDQQIRSNPDSAGLLRSEYGSDDLMQYLLNRGVSKKADIARRHADIDAELARRNEMVTAGRTNSDGSLAGDGPMFREGTGQQSTPTVSTPALKAALAGTPYGSNVIVLDSPALLPDARLRLQLKRTGNLGAKGAYDAKTGKTYLFAHNAESMADAMETAKGEILHRGTFVYAKDLADQYGGDVQKAFNELNALHMQIIAVRGPEINAWLDKEGYKELVNTPRGANEWLAHEGSKAAPKWYDRYVAAVMKFFRKVGKAINFDFGLTEAEIRNFSRELLEAGASGRETLQGKNPSPMLQRTYQGSPTRGIVRMDDAYLGTGEGGRSETNNDYSGAYGYGHYSAQSKDTAEWYRNALTEGGDVRSYINEIIYALGNKGKSSVSDVTDQLSRYKETEGLSSDAQVVMLVKDALDGYDAKSDSYSDAGMRALSELDRILPEKPVGQLYQLEVPDSDKLLDWNKTLSEQPEGVREKLDPIIDYFISQVAPENDFEGAKERMMGSMKGGQFYAFDKLWKMIDEAGAFTFDGDKSVSQYLDSIGIPGHQYLDGMSRSQGDGSRNVVTYSDKNIDITGTFYRKATPQATLSQQPPADAKGIKGYINETSKALAVTAKGAWNDTNDASWIRKVTTSPEYWTDEHAQKMFDVFNQRDEIASKYVHDFMAMPGKDQESVIPFFQEVVKDPANRALLNEGVDYADVNEVSEKDMLKWWQSKNAPADVVKAWTLMRQKYDAALDARLKPIKDALENTKRDAKITVKDDNGKDQTISLKQLINRMGALRGTYAPRIRETGDFVVKGKFTYRDGRVENFRAHKESRLAANKLIQEMRGKGYEMEEVPKTTHLPESTQQSVKAIELAKAIEGALSNMTGVDEKTKAEFAKTLAEGVADEIKARGFRSASIRRQKENVTKGYIEDATERFQKYMFNTANGLAKMETAGKAVDVMFGEVKDGKRQGGVDIKKKPEIHSLLTEYMNEQLRNQDKSDRTLGKLKALATLKFLGFNIKSAAVNLTALATNVPAALHTYAMDGKGSLTSAMPVLGKSVKDFAGFMRDKKLQNSDEQAFLEDAHKRGLDDAQFTRESSKKFGDTMGQAWQTTMEWSMKMFGKTEQLNRGATLLAAYRLARQRGLSHAEASSIAQHTSNRAHGVYSKAANPTWAWGTGVGPRVGQSVYVYQKFMHNYFQMVYEMVGKKDYKAAAYALTAPLVIAGGTGQMVSKALAYTIAKAAMAVAGDEGDPEKWMYDQIRDIGGKNAETFARYGLAGLAGLNLSGSMGTIPSIPTDLAGLAGAPGGIFKDMGAAASYLGTGEFTKAAEKALPSAFGKPIQAIREANQGVTTASGYRVLDDEGKPYKPSLGESLTKAMAFSPSGESMQRQRTFESKTEEGKFSDRSKKIYERIRAAAVDGKTDPAEMQAIANEVTKYNASVAKAGNPAINQITPQSVANQFKAMEMPNKKDLKRLAGRQDVEGEVFTPDMVETASHPYNVARAKANRDHQDYLEMKKTNRQGAEKFWHQGDRFRKWAVLNDYGKEITRLRQSMEKVQDSQMSQAAKERQLVPLKNRVKVLMDRAVSRVQ